MRLWGTWGVRNKRSKRCLTRENPAGANFGEVYAGGPCGWVFPTCQMCKKAPLKFDRVGEGTTEVGAVSVKVRQNPPTSGQIRMSPNPTKSVTFRQNPAKSGQIRSYPAKCGKIRLYTLTLCPSKTHWPFARQVLLSSRGCKVWADLSWWGCYHWKACLGLENAPISLPKDRLSSRIFARWSWKCRDEIPSLWGSHVTLLTSPDNAVASFLWGRSAPSNIVKHARVWENSMAPSSAIIRAILP